MPLKSFFQKIRFRFEFFYETTPSPIFGAKRTMWCVSRKKYHERRVQSLLPKTPPKSFFRKTRFRSDFFYKTTLHLFSRPNKLCGAFRDKIVRDKNFACFCLKNPQNSFSEKHISSLNFFTKPPPHLFSRPNGLCGAFQGKIDPDKNFTGFCLKRPQNCFSAKHVSRPNLFTKPPRTYFRGQIDYVTRFEAKLSQTKTSFCFALNAPEIVFV